MTKLAKPVRLQLSRKRGFNLQRLSMETNGLPAVNVARSAAFHGYGVFGNPFPCTRGSHCHKVDGDDEPYCCVECFEEYVRSGIEGRAARTGTLKGALLATGDNYRHRDNLVSRLPDLRGHNLACWCPLTDEAGNPCPCHADVLLELAARGAPSETDRRT